MNIDRRLNSLRVSPLCLPSLCNRSALRNALVHTNNQDVAVRLYQSGADAFEEDYEGFSPFGIAIAVLPSFALFLLQEKSKKMGTLGKSVVWKHNFEGIVIDKEGNPVLVHDFKQIEDLIRKVQQQVKRSGRIGVQEPQVPQRRATKAAFKTAPMVGDTVDTTGNAATNTIQQFSAGETDDNEGSKTASRKRTSGRELFDKAATYGQGKREKMKAKLEGVLHQKVTALHLMYSHKRKDLLLTPCIR